ncbi:MAG: hypothetical protein JWM89_1809 [Acidimicrobiales bacterium]|nr:hypothetical protein [Acidimicrobiales bacterium]
MRNFLFPVRATEASATQVAATGAGQWGDLADDTKGFRGAIGAGPRAVPDWTLERARTFSVAGYRANPMVKAIIDTYTSFCVGDSGLTVQCTVPDVHAVVDKFRTDRRNRDVGGDIWLRDHMLMGETVLEPMVGPMSGRVRLSIIAPERIAGVSLVGGNPLWLDRIHLAGADNAEGLAIIDVDDMTGRRTGDIEFWASWQALLTDTRGYPFLAPILDWLDAYDQVIWNLIDRTALARHLVFDVTVDGDQTAVDAFVAARGGRHAPKSGSVEVHNNSVTWATKTADVGSFEDTNTGKTILTNIAGGAGLAKTWLADAEDANRATSLTMAEPVRRRVGGVQNVWLAYQQELLRFVVDKAVEARTLPELVDVPGSQEKLDPAETVSITGPEIAAADAQVTAEVLANLAQGLTGLVAANLMTPEAARVASKKAWEDYAGIPYEPQLDQADGSRVDDVAGEVARNQPPTP